MIACPDPRMQELLGAWVLGACPPEEDAAVADHLHACPSCTETVAELRRAREALLTVVPPIAPAPELKARVMADVRGEAALFGALRPERPRPRAWTRRRIPALAAAALAAGAVGLGVLAGGLAWQDGTAPTPAPVERVLAAQVEPAAGARAGARLRLRGSVGRLELDGLRSPGRGRVYQIWLQTGTSDPVATDALFGVRDGRAVVAVPGDLRGVDRVLVTAEPAGGSDAPTSDPVVAVAL